jgi:branched-chain amino acid transport system substrate-binding protein
MKKISRLGVGLLGLALLASACGGDDSDSSSATTAAASGSAAAAGNVKCSGVKLAYLGALSGENGALGQNMVDGATIAVDEWNTANKDCKIELEKFDSQGDPTQATPLADKIVQDKAVVALVGPGFSGETKATMPKFEEAGLPIISPSATNAQLQNNGWKTFHRVLANDDKQGPAIARLIKSKGAKKVGVIDDASEYGKGLADTVRKELGSLKVADDTIDPKASDYSAAVNKMKAAGVDYVFYGGYYAEASKLIKQLRAAGVTSTFVGGDGVLDQKFIDNAGKDADGALISATGAPANVNPDFQKKFNDKYKKDPTLYAPESYDIVNVFLNALAAGSQDRASILKFLTTYDKPGVTKEIKFDSKGEVAGEAVYSYQVAGGKISGIGVIP